LYQSRLLAGSPHWQLRTCLSRKSRRIRLATCESHTWPLLEADHSKSTRVEEPSFADRNCTSQKEGYGVVDCGRPFLHIAISAYVSRNGWVSAYRESPVLYRRRLTATSTVAVGILSDPMRLKGRTELTELFFQMALSLSNSRRGRFSLGRSVVRSYAPMFLHSSLHRVNRRHRMFVARPLHHISSSDSASAHAGAELLSNVQNTVSKVHVEVLRTCTAYEMQNLAQCSLI
jgi:hypothetical protein